jgi:hypothetical protein
VTCFEDARQVFQSAFAALELGGYLEIQDAVFPVSFAEPVDPDCAFATWNELSIEGAIARGKPWTNPPNYASWLRELGFVDVCEHKFMLPVGPWPEDDMLKRVGTLQLKNWLTGLETMTVGNLAAIGWSVDECKVLVTKVKEELEKQTLRAYNDILVVIGRKPLE